MARGPRLGKGSQRCPLAVRGKSPPWPFSTWATPKKAEVFWGRRSPLPAAAGSFHSLPGGEQAIHDPITEAGVHASADPEPLVSRKSGAQVPLNGLSVAAVLQISITCSNGVRSSQPAAVASRINGSRPRSRYRRHSSWISSRSASGFRFNSSTMSAFDFMPPA